MATPKDWIEHFSHQAKVGRSHARDYYTISHPKEIIQVISPVAQTTDMARASLKRKKILGRPPGSTTKKRKSAIVKVTKKKGGKVLKLKKTKKTVVKKRTVKKKK